MPEGLLVNLKAHLLNPWSISALHFDYCLSFFFFIFLFLSDYIFKYYEVIFLTEKYSKSSID